MDDIKGWIAAIVCLVALLLDRIDRRKAGMKDSMDARLKPIQEGVAALKLQQDETAGEVASLTVAQGRLDQRMGDHEKQDAERFDAIGGYFAEIRGQLSRLPGEIKDLLR